MAKSLAQIQKQIDKLQREAAQIRSKEAKAVIARIQEAIQHYNITKEELFPSRSKAERKPGAKAATKTRKTKGSPPKYHDGQGNTWTGRGRQPRWFASAIADGKTAEDMLISGGAK